MVGRGGPMTPLKAIVKNGRLVLDEPTELPEGTEIGLWTSEDPPDPVYERVSLTDLDVASSGEHPLPELVMPDGERVVPPPLPKPPGSAPRVFEESEFPVSPRAPARSVIARRHIATVSKILVE